MISAIKYLLCFEKQKISTLTRNLEVSFACVCHLGFWVFFFRCKSVFMVFYFIRAVIRVKVLVLIFLLVEFSQMTWSGPSRQTD